MPPSRLRPTAPLAPRAILVGDPGRSLLLAQALLEQPKMSNHARGLWGYSGRTPSGAELTIQATGMGAPSAALVLADLAALGVERAVRLGSCAGLDDRARLGELLVVEGALALGGSIAAFGLEIGDTATPDPGLRAGLEASAEGARGATVASLDSADPEANGIPDVVAAVDLQTAAVLARAPQLGIAAAALLIVSERGGERLDDEGLEAAAKTAGAAAAATLLQA